MGEEHYLVLAAALKGGWHDFQYFDHKSSWQWDLWENVLKIFLNYKNFQKIKFSFFQD
jgi:hypothetical protein